MSLLAIVPISLLACRPIVRTGIAARVVVTVAIALGFSIQIGPVPGTAAARAYDYDAPATVVQVVRIAASEAATSTTNHANPRSTVRVTRTTSAGAPSASTPATSLGRATKAESKLIGPAGGAAAQGLSRVDRFRARQRDGIQIGEQRFGINDHLINSVRKSGQRQVTPEDLINALRQPAGPASPGSRSYSNPGTGSRFFVNDADEVVGVYPKGFK